MLDKASFGRTTDKAAGYEMRINYQAFLGVQLERDIKNNPKRKLFEAVTIQPPISQALYQRFETIDNKIKELISIVGKMKQLAHNYYKAVYNKDIEIPKNALRSQDVACAIVEANLYNHLYNQELTLPELETALKDPEEGTFLFNIYSDKFINSENQKINFPGHTFVIMKVVEGSETGYRFIHSILNVVNLDDFIESKTNRYDDFDTLRKHILDPFYSLLKKQGPWGEEETQNYYLITSMYSKCMEGYFPPSGRLVFDISRTKNTPSESLPQLVSSYTLRE